MIEATTVVYNRQFNVSQAPDGYLMLGTYYGNGVWSFKSSINTLTKIYTDGLTDVRVSPSFISSGVIQVTGAYSGLMSGGCIFVVGTGPVSLIN